MADGKPGEGTVFGSEDEAIYAFESQDTKDPWLDLHAKVKVRTTRPVTEADATADAATASGRTKGTHLVETSVGRVMFNATLPPDYPFVNKQLGKQDMSRITDTLIVTLRLDGHVRRRSTASSRSRSSGRRSRASRSRSNDVAVPPAKPAILDRYEKEAEKVESQYSRGLLTDDERRQELIEIWMKATDEVTQAMKENFGPLNAINMMSQSGARGNIDQVRQLAGMRGLVANPKGEIIPRPIKSNFREGLTVLEYFISTHGARKGLADTALRTADSGYLTRRLVDVSQEVIVREIDCGTDKGLTIPGNELRSDHDWDTRIFGRVLAEAVKRERTTVVKKDTEVDRPTARAAARPSTPKRSSCARSSRASRASVCARAATARTSRSGSSSTSAKRSASSPPSRSVSRARSSRCGRSTPVVSPVSTSRTVCRVSSSCSTRVTRRVRPTSPRSRAPSGSRRRRRRARSSSPIARRRGVPVHGSAPRPPAVLRRRRDQRR